MFTGAEVIPFQLGKGWLKKLYDELLRIATARKNELQRIADHYGDPQYLAKFYVQPDCQQFNPADDNEDESGVMVREPILKRIEAYLSGPASHRRPHLFILSDAGMGKTSLLMMLKLAHLTSFWPKGFGCELLKLGTTTLDDIAKIQNKSNTVLLLDALDEDPLAWGRTEQRLADILRATATFRRTLITCRTQFFSGGEDPFHHRGNVEVSGFSCPVIYNSLFTEEQTEEYLRRRAAEHKTDGYWLPRAKAIVQQMGSLRMRPMLLTHVDDFLESTERHWTEYTIYKALIQAWLKREQRKLEIPDAPRPSVNDLWDACRRLALFLTVNQKQHVTEQALEELIRSFPTVASIPFMHIGGRSLLNKDSKGNYRFSHFSIQEFLVVNAALEGNVDHDLQSVRLTDFMNHLVIAWLKSATAQDATKLKLLPVSLANADLSNADLRGFNFSGLCLDGANLSGSNLGGAQFVSASMRGSKLVGCSMQNTSFKSAHLEDAVLNSIDATGAEFQYAWLHGAQLQGALLDKAKFHYAKLSGAVYDRETDWPWGFLPEREGAVLQR